MGQARAARLALRPGAGGRRPSRNSAPKSADAFRRTFDVAEKCDFAFAGIVPPLPADIFPVTLRDEVMSRLRAARDLGWDERERAKRELAVIEKSGFAPVLPHRPRRRRVRPPQRHPPQPQGLGRVVVSGLPARHLPRQPGRLRPLLRALPQQRPRRPAGHRPRLRLALPRQGPGLRPREIRTGEDGRGLRLQPEELRRPLGPLRDGPGLRPSARGVAGAEQAGAVFRRAGLSQEDRAGGRTISTSGSWPANSRAVYHEISLHVGGVILTPGARRPLPAAREIGQGLRHVPLRPGRGRGSEAHQARPALGPGAGGDLGDEDAARARRPSGRRRRRRSACSSRRGRSAASRSRARP